MGKILIVDDLEHNRVAMAAVLRSVEAEVITAASGDAALALCTQHDFAMVLLDVSMPIMDGYEVAALLRQREETRYLPILFITGQAVNLNQLVKGYETGAVDYILKPVDGQILISKAQVFLELYHRRRTQERYVAELAAQKEQLENEVSERKRVEQILLSMVDAVLIVSMEGVLEKVNRPELFGYSREELLGRPLSDLLLEEEKGNFFGSDWLAGLLQAGAIHNDEITLVTKAGNPIPVLVSGSVFRDAAEKITGVILVAKEISEYRQAQQALREKDAMLLAAQMASQAKSAFLANMSHEIRTPMNAVMGLTDLAMQSEDLSKIRDYLTKVASSSSLLMRIINDILDFSKIEAGKLELEAVPFDLRDLLAQMADLFQSQIDQKKLAWSTEIAAECPTELVGDPLRIEQVLMNLVSNAVKFTDTGTIVIQIGWRKPDHPDADQVVLEFMVHDTGIGMSEEQMVGLFDPFVQADISTTRRYGGTGLGLSICKRLIEQMSGAIGVTSTPGQGTRFSFHIILRQQTALEKSQRSTSSPPLPGQKMDLDAIKAKMSGARVLLAEDNIINQMVAREMLQILGLVVEVASNGADAIQMLATAPFDLVLMDIQMPSMDGYTATKNIRQQAQWAKLPIIAMTAHSTESDRRACLLAGMDDHLAKPIEKQKLYAALLAWIKPRTDCIVTPLPESEIPPPSTAGMQVAQMPALLPGIDLSAGLDRLDGNHRLYRSLLLEFAREFGQADQQLREYLTGLRANDVESARMLLHGIKGMAGNLSAKEIFLAAQALEKGIKEDHREKWPTLLESFAITLQRGMDAIQTLQMNGKANTLACSG